MLRRMIMIILGVLGLCCLQRSAFSQGGHLTPPQEAWLRQIYLSRTSLYDQAVIDARHWTNFHSIYSNTLYSLLSRGVTNFSYSYGDADIISQTGHTAYFVFNTNLAPLSIVSIAEFGSNTALAVSNMLVSLPTNNWNWSTQAVIAVSNELSNLPTNNWNWSTQAVIAVSNMIGGISIGAVTNGINGIWELSEDLAGLSVLSRPQAWSAGLWVLNSDGSVSPSGATTYDTLWTTNATGDIIPR